MLTYKLREIQAIGYIHRLCKETIEISIIVLQLTQNAFMNDYIQSLMGYYIVPTVENF